MRSNSLTFVRAASRLENVGQFPKRIRLGINRVAWLLSEIEAWVDERLANRDIPEEKISSF
jgi:prophage regulatory protein